MSESYTPRFEPGTRLDPRMADQLIPNYYKDLQLIFNQIEPYQPDLSVSQFYRTVTAQLSKTTPEGYNGLIETAIHSENREVATKAKELFVFSHLKSVIQAADKYQHDDLIDIDDLIQTGIVGLCEIADSIRRRKYRGRDVDEEAERRLYSKQSQNEDIPPALISGEQGLQIKKRILEELEKHPYGLNADQMHALNAELSAEFDFSDRGMLRVYITYLNSLSAKEPATISSEEAVEEPAIKAVLKEDMFDMLVNLSEDGEEFAVLGLQFGILEEGPLSDTEISRLIGTTRERIRQIGARGLHKLRHPLRSRRLRDYRT